MFSTDAVPDTGKSVTSLSAVALVKTTVLPSAAALAKPESAPLKGAVLLEK
jgi:hypothetical protein